MDLERQLLDLGVHYQAPQMEAQRPLATSTAQSAVPPPVHVPQAFQTPQNTTDTVSIKRRFPPPSIPPPSSTSTRSLPHLLPQPDSQYVMVMPPSQPFCQQPVPAAEQQPVQPAPLAKTTLFYRKKRSLEYSNTLNIHVFL